ncbi:MAG: hypothetical protein ABH864_05620 [archaeon]
MSGEKDELRTKLGELQKLVAAGQIPGRALIMHEKAGHVGHARCVDIGLNATIKVMCTNGAQGTYFTMDEGGRIYEQHFTQGSDEHDYGKCEGIGMDEFLDRVGGLSYGNMARIGIVLRNVNRYLGMEQ